MMLQAARGGLDGGGDSALAAALLGLPPGQGAFPGPLSGPASPQDLVPAASGDAQPPISPSLPALVRLLAQASPGAVPPLGQPSVQGLPFQQPQITPGAFGGGVATGDVGLPGGNLGGGVVQGGTPLASLQAPISRPQVTPPLPRTPALNDSGDPNGVLQLLQTPPASTGPPAWNSGNLTPGLGGGMVQGSSPNVAGAVPPATRTVPLPGNFPTGLPPDAQPGSGYAQQPAVGAIPSGYPIGGTAPRALGVGVNATAPPTTPQTALASNPQLPAQEYAATVRSALAPTFEAQDQALAENLAGMGVLNSGQASKGFQDLTGQQSAAIANAVAPLIAQGYQTEATTNLTNAGATNATRALGYGGELSTYQLGQQLGEQGALANLNTQTTYDLANLGALNSQQLAQLGYSNAGYQQLLQDAYGLVSGGQGASNQIAIGSVPYGASAYQAGMNLASNGAAGMGAGSVGAPGYGAVSGAPIGYDSNGKPVYNQGGTPSFGVGDPDTYEVSGSGGGPVVQNGQYQPTNPDWGNTVPDLGGL